MPKKDSDYSNTIIYKISCKDKAVTDVYVGHTINFVQRKISHEQNSKSNTCKLYQIIRNNGGWSNWIMEIIAFFNCANCTEARMKEQEYFLSLHANLNSIEPFTKKEEKEKKVNAEKEKKVNAEKEKKVKEENEKKVKEENEKKVEEDVKVIVNVKEEEVEEQYTSINHKKFLLEKYNCNLCNFGCSKNSNFEKHLLTNKHIKISGVKNNIEKYNCNLCNFGCSKNSNFQKHLLTNKHITITGHIKNIKNIELISEKHSCICGKKYKYRQGLYTHKHSCKELEKKHNIVCDTSEEIKNLSSMISEMIKNNNDYKSTMIKNHNDFKSIMILNQ